MNRLINFYHMTFYHVQKAFVFDKEDDAVLSSFLVIAAIQWFNLIVLVIILDLLDLIDLNIFFKSNYFELKGFAPCLLLLLGNYLYFTSDDKYKAILSEYSKKPKALRKKGAIIILLYGIGSLLLVFVLAPLRVM